MNEKYFSQRRWGYLIFGIALGLAAVLGFGLINQPHHFGGTAMQTPQPAYDFSLTSQDGKEVRLSDQRGKVVLLFFGYTSCPDVCPITLQTLHQVVDRIGQQAERVQVIFISVDPEKDTPQRIKAYLASIDPRILGLTGDLPIITQTASQYGVYIQKQFYNDRSDYSIDHTAVVELIDPQGYLQVVYPYETSAQAIASDVQFILKR